jgi:predicted HTH domain antitoxin
MSQLIEIELPDELSAALQRDASDLGEELRLTAAVKWYEQGRLSQGKAAEVAGLTRSAFLSELARFGVTPFQENSDEILEAVRLLPR